MATMIGIHCICYTTISSLFIFHTILAIHETRCNYKLPKYIWLNYGISPRIISFDQQNLSYRVGVTGMPLEYFAVCLNSVTVLITKSYANLCMI